MAYTATKLIALAAADVGYLEKASNAQLDDKTANAGRNNYTKFARDLFAAGYYNGNKQGQPWCDTWVDHKFWELCDKSKEKAEAMTCQTGSLGAGCRYSANYYRKQGRFFKTPKFGDQVFFGPKGAETHTGLVRKVTATHVYTTEGNTSPSSGVVPNGGGVWNKVYPLGYSQISGYGRPYYDKEIEVDGKWDSDLTERLQEIFGTTVDGVISNQHAQYKASNPGLRSGWEWKSKPNGKGSDLIRAMQKWAGMAAGDCDGEIGPKTIKAFQRKLGTTVDGKVSSTSAMVKALQKWANKQ